MDLIERDVALRELDTAWQAASGAGCLLLLCGEAGIGKTSLVQAFLNHQPGHTQQLWGACDALYTPRPLGPLYDMAPQLDQAFVDRLHEGANRPAIFAAFLQVLQRRPTLAVVEDIHWADEATLDLLKYVGRRIHLTPSLLLLTYRDDEISAQHPLRLLVGDLATSPAVRRITLDPLSAAGVAQLAGDKVVDAGSLHHLTGGNPFYVTEALASGMDGIPPTVRDAVLARAARLSLSGRAVLNAAAVAGPRIEPWLLNEMTRAEASAVSEILDAGMLQAHGDVLAFRHELARQAILESIPPHQRVFLHHAALDALRTSPDGEKDVARLAHHAEGAGDHEAILIYARAAGKEAAALGNHRAAAALYALALRYAEDLPLIEQIELNEAYALSVQGEPSRKETIAARRRAVELAQRAELPLRQGYNLAVLATSLEMIDKMEEANRVLDEALAILEPRAPNRGLVDLYKNLAIRNLQNGDAEKAVAYAEKSLAMAQWTEKTELVIGVYQVLGLCSLPLDRTRAYEHLEKALAMAREHDDYWTAGATFPNLAMTYVDDYRLQRAEQLVAEGIAFTTEHDMDVAVQVLEGWRAMIALHKGRWAQAEAQAEALLARPSVHPYALTPARLVLGRLLARKGEDGAESRLDEALAGLKKSGNRQRWATAYTARAEAAWLSGDRQRVLTEVDAVYEFSVQNKQPGFAAELAYWRWHAGQPVETYDWMVRAFVLEIEGNWRDAAAEWERLGCPYEQARALAHDDTEAQKAALVTFEELGAQPMAEWTRQRLRDAGVQTIPRGPRSDTRQNPFGLTNRQLQVLGLLVEELTNAEIAERLHISPKTVDHHVSAVLARLDVSSREEAAELARQHQEF